MGVSKMRQLILLLISITVFFSYSSAVLADDGLKIHGVEYIVGKFHRQDNKVHKYAPSNSWTPFILPEGYNSTEPLVQSNADGSVSIFFSTLEDLITAAIKVADARDKKIDMLTIHSHGLPGGVWFPKDR